MRERRGTTARRSQAGPDHPNNPGKSQGQEPRDATIIEKRAGLG